MVIGKKFAWAHIPRTGGDITAELFQLADSLMNHNLIIEAITSSSQKEDTFDKENINPGLILALNIRRLPSFLMSWIIMCAGRLRKDDTKCFVGGVYPLYKQALPVPTKKQLLDKNEPYGPVHFAEYYGGCFATLPDFLLKKYIGNYTINHWLRLEHLKYDFLEFIKSIEPNFVCHNKAVLQYQFTVKTPFNYNHDVLDFFSPNELRVLYDNNPLWRKIEGMIYS